MSYFTTPFIHDSISSSISDANDVPKRMINIMLGFLSAMMISLLIDEYLSRLKKNSNNDISLYIVNITSYLTLVLIGVFPGGSSYRRSPNYKKIIDILHVISSFLTFILMNICNIIYSFNTKKHVFGWITGIFSGGSIIACFAFLAIQSINIRNNEMGGNGDDHQSINNQNGNQNNHGNYRRNKLSYLFEIITFSICILFFSILSSLYRNDNYDCIEHNDTIDKMFI